MSALRAGFVRREALLASILVSSVMGMAPSVDLGPLAERPAEPSARRAVSGGLHASRPLRRQPFWTCEEATRMRAPPAKKDPNR
jgi:hypothetical protein